MKSRTLEARLFLLANGCLTVAELLMIVEPESYQGMRPVKISLNITKSPVKL